jgi:hypothetical protein
VAQLSYFPFLINHEILGKRPSVSARQRLRENANAAMNTKETTKESLNSFSERSVSYQGRQAITSSRNLVFILGMLYRNPSGPSVVHSVM